MERVLREVMREADLARADGERVAEQEREDSEWDADHAPDMNPNSPDEGAFWRAAQP